LNADHFTTVLLPIRGPGNAARHQKGNGMTRPLWIIPLLTAAVILQCHSRLLADLVLTTSTLDSAGLDFDGSGAETYGDLGVATRTFAYSGETIPDAPGFTQIGSMTLTFQSATGTTFSAGGVGISANGIGLTYPGESGPGDIESLSDGAGEVMSLFVSSTSTIPGEQVAFTGLTINSWRNGFPLSEVTLSGATFAGGQTVLTGGSGVSPEIVFDAPVFGFSIESTGPDPIRLASIRLATTAVPEPASGVVCGIVAIGLGGVRDVRNRKRSRIGNNSDARR
jgi:hypothetical protein